MTGIAVSSANCGCDVTDDGPYSTPSADGAPWHDTSRPESDEFLGFMALGITLDPVVIRSVSPKLSNGATIGKAYSRHRIVAFGGYLIANSAQGMSYGERWLNGVLAGQTQGCAPDTLRILLACPSGSGSSQFRTLRQVGIVDGPNYGPAEEMPECYIQSIQFQMAAGVPWLLGDEMSCGSLGYS